MSLTIFPQLFISLDLESRDSKVDEIIEIVKTNPNLGLKIHSVFDELVFADGLDRLKGLENKLWYDAKLADIPSTITKRVLVLAKYFDYLTIQLESCGLEGALAASEVRDKIYQQTGKYLKLIGVTILTSKDSQKYSLQTGINKDLAVKNLMQIAIESQLDGLVCSGKEASMAKYLIDKNNSKIKIITPGIRPTWAVSNSTQNRITTPKEAIQNGADSLVVGTAIIDDKDPKKATEKILAEILDTQINKQNSYKKFSKSTQKENLQNQSSLSKKTNDIGKDIVSSLTSDQKIACLNPVELFRSVGAVYYLEEKNKADGTWCRLTSGRLSPFYINIGGAIDGNPKILSRLAQDMASLIRNLNLEPELTIGAMMGSVRLSSYVASFLDIPSLYAEKEEANKKAHETEFVFKRHKVKPGQKVVITEDLVTQGTTLAKLIKVLKKAEAEILGIFLTINRSGITEVDGIKIHALESIEPFSVDEEEFKKTYPKAKISEKPKNQWNELITTS